ncbi:glycoside hydrolase family 70 protein [Oenococcus sp.]|uniref:glycoside hydrolase family 70 protein n=1 Tax=Oenococcus sp. TaxID=1979414 RepID=UPI0039EC22AE
MERKARIDRKKLYKSGKNWIVASTTVFMMAAGSNLITVQADDLNQEDTTAQSVAPLTAAADQSEPTSQSAEQPETDEISQTVSPTPAAIVPHYVQQAGNWFYMGSDGQFVKGLQTIDGSLQFFDEQGIQIKGSFETVDGSSYYFDSQSGNAVTGFKIINNDLHHFEADGKETVNNYATDKQGNIFYFDENGQMATGVKTIQGQSYYFDQDGYLRKGYSGVFDNQVLYFDKTTGALTNTNVSSIKEGLTAQNDDFTAHNAVYSAKSESFTNIDGYLTAEAWYRPADILDDGVNWRASRADEFRPILTTWWPDKQTEVNYLNFMKTQGFITNDQDFKIADDQLLLNHAAQSVQGEIEKKISQQGSTDWLKTLLQTFINQQPSWNGESEDPGSDHLQGGALTFVNSPLTPDSNSNFRLLNRTPTNQTGTPQYDTDASLGGFELLLANDVDNSNPVVQAEQLNWLYYLLNFGSITADDPDANFDGIRIDAVDNVDADLLQIAAAYFKDAFKSGSNDLTTNQHLSILEDWSHNDPEYMKAQGYPQLTMDDYMHTQLIWSLTKPDNIRGTMQRFMDYYLVNRANDSTDNEAVANYSFVRAHDSEVQTVIAQIISDLYPNSGSGLIPTTDQLNAAFEVYNADMKSDVKKYTQYNIPSAYAMLLTNKDTVPRVYYGDMYTDDGDYMANKSPYFDAISTLLKARVKYAAGGQSMAVDQNDILTSVRFGQNAMLASDSGDNQTRQEGIGVIVSNNSHLKLAENDQVVLHMGAAHKNQAFRALLLTTESGLENFDTDLQAPVKYTDANGDLIFTAAELAGYLNPEVSGYLSAWVPVGAADNQDARTTADSAASVDGSVYHSNAALDSNVIFEGFSNFQSIPTAEQHDNFTNVKITENAGLFKDWGITSFQLAPQYRSSSDSSFLDSIIQNGYAFTDRYDVGFDTPTKYGDVDDLRAAIKALHANNIQVMADWVPDQIYNLQNPEIITVNRTDSYGQLIAGSDLQNDLYLAYTNGGGQYQTKFGGAFLEKLQQLYPDLFTKTQISTGQTIDPSQKITEWSAKYFNGSNIQGRGAYYVLRDSGTDQYFKVVSNDENEAFLPKQLTNQPGETGFTQDDQGIIFFSTSGYQAKNAFVQGDDGNYYYFDNTGHMVTGPQTINGQHYLFFPNGVEAQNVFVQNDRGETYYYDQRGRQVANQYVTDTNGNSFRFDENGIMLANQLAQIDGHWQFFKSSGVEAKDAFILGSDGRMRYFESGNGNMAVNEFKGSENGRYYYFGADGLAVTGLQTINGRQLYFDDHGQQMKDAFYTNQSGQRFYFNALTGDLVKGDFIYTSASSSFTPDDNTAGSYQGDSHLWYYADSQGQIVTGFQTINGHLQYFDDISGQMITNRFMRRSDGNWIYLDENGEAVRGMRVINGLTNYFRDDFTQIKDGFAQDPNSGEKHYFNGTNGAMVTNDYFSPDKIHWYYADDSGQPVTGFQNINGQVQYFGQDGIQLKGGSQTDPVTQQTYYFDDKFGNGQII